MPNFNTHAKVGAIVGGIYGLAVALSGKDEPIEFDQIIKHTFVGAVGGFLGSVLPDVIEPANGNPNHRSIAHSLAIGEACFIKVCDMAFDRPANSEKLLLTSAAIGYLSHLVLDAKTPKGLPFIC